MKKYFGNYDDCVAAWLHQGQEQGKVRHNRMFFEGPTLYSYGYHFKIASIRNSYVLLNTDKYSNTTSKQQCLVRWHLRNTYRQQIFLPAEWWGMDAVKLREECIKVNEPLLAKAVRARCHGQRHLDEAAHNQQQVAAFITQLERNYE